MYHYLQLASYLADSWLTPVKSEWLLLAVLEKEFYYFLALNMLIPVCINGGGMFALLTYSSVVWVLSCSREAEMLWA